MQACSDQALGLLCRLLESPDTEVHPDTVRYSGDREAYERLYDIQALSPAGIVAGSILCPWCGSERLHSFCFDPGGYQGCCNECGWLELEPLQVMKLRLDYPRIVRWLAAALGLTARFQLQDLVSGHLWRLGEIEHRRKRRTLLFGRRLDDERLAESLDRAVQTVAAPGARVLITTTAPESLEEGPGDCRIVPLRAIAHLRKAGFVVENLEAYLDVPLALEEDSAESSLRLLHTGRMALVAGKSIRVPPQVQQFLLVLIEAGGKPVHKRQLADALEADVESCKGSEIFKRHKAVYQAFVEHDQEGRYWLKPEFLPQ